MYVYIYIYMLYIDYNTISNIHIYTNGPLHGNEAHYNTSSTTTIQSVRTYPYYFASIFFHFFQICGVLCTEQPNTGTYVRSKSKNQSNQASPRPTTQKKYAKYTCLHQVLTVYTHKKANKFLTVAKYSHPKPHIVPKIQSPHKMTSWLIARTPTLSKTKNHVNGSIYTHHAPNQFFGWTVDTHKPNNRRIFIFF